MKKETVKNIIAAVVVLAAFSFVFHQLYIGWDKLQQQAADWDFSPAYLALSAMLVFLNFMMTAVAYKWIVTALGQKLTLRTSFYIFFSTQIGRYVPGKFWIFMGQAYLAKKHELSQTAAATGGMYHVIVGNLSGLVLASVMLLAGFSKLASPWLLAAVAAGILLFLLFAPAQVERLLNLLLVKMNRSPIRLTLPKLTVILLVIWLMGAWLVSASSFVALTASVMPVTLSQALTIGAVFIVGYVIGFFVFFVPGGLGVREGLFTTLLPFAPSVAGVLALASRLIITLVEVMAFFIAQAIAPKNDSSTNKDAP